MGAYFPERRQIGQPFTVIFDSGNARVDCTIYERWKEKTRSVPVYCGTPSEYAVERTLGLDEKRSSSVESTITSTLGVQGVASFKSSVKAIIGTEINWNYSFREKQSFQCVAPECGHYEIVVYQFVRDYHLTYFRRGAFPFRHNVWNKKWGPEPFTEYIHRYDSTVDRADYDEQCGCPPPSSPDCEGLITLSFDGVSFQAPYTQKDKQITLTVGERPYSFPLTTASLSVPQKALLPANLFPPSLLFLAGISAEEKVISVEVRKGPVYDPSVPDDEVYVGEGKAVLLEDVSDLAMRAWHDREAWRDEYSDETSSSAEDLGQAKEQDFQH